MLCFYIFAEIEVHELPRADPTHTSQSHTLMTTTLGEGDVGLVNEKERDEFVTGEELLGKGVVSEVGLVEGLDEKKYVTVEDEKIEEMIYGYDKEEDYKSDVENVTKIVDGYENNCIVDEDEKRREEVVDGDEKKVGDKNEEGLMEEGTEKGVLIVVFGDEEEDNPIENPK